LYGERSACLLRLQQFVELILGPGLTAQISSTLDEQWLAFTGLGQGGTELATSQLGGPALRTVEGS
jgi:hypothetical protein